MRRACLARDRVQASRLAVSQVIDAPSHTVWEILTDTSKWVEWGPSIRAVDCADRFVQGTTRGRVKTVLGVWAPFLITDYRSGYYWSWNVFGLPATGHRVDSLPDSRCSLAFTVPLAAAPYLVVCRAAVARIERLALG